MSVRLKQPCQKFNANIFDKTKCRNCMKSREDHLLADPNLQQSKVLIQGWLLMAAMDTDFTNLAHKSRKWQRRYFSLYEHGALKYALDESQTTIAQGDINLNQIRDIQAADVESGHKNSLKISTAENPKGLYVRAEDRETFLEWRQVLQEFMQQQQDELKQRKRRQNLRIRAQTQQVTGINSSANERPLASDRHTNDRYSSDLTGGRCNSDRTYGDRTYGHYGSPGSSGVQASGSFSGNYESSTLPKNLKIEGGVGNSIIRCKSESHGSHSRHSWEPSVYPPAVNRRKIQQASASSVPVTPDDPPPVMVPEIDESLRFVSHVDSLNSGLNKQHSAQLITKNYSMNSLDEDQNCNSPVDDGLGSSAEIEVNARGRAPVSRAQRRAQSYKERSRLSNLQVGDELKNEENNNTSDTKLQITPDNELPGRLVSSDGVTNKPHSLENCNSSPSLPKTQHSQITHSSNLMPATNIRRTKSLDRRVYELNDNGHIKSGWLQVQNSESGDWDKFFVVLKDHFLQIYESEEDFKDLYQKTSAPEDVNVVEINLKNCLDVSEFPVQSNYGFQISTPVKTHTLAAISLGVRRSWVLEIRRKSEGVDEVVEKEKLLEKNSSFGEKSSFNDKIIGGGVSERSSVFDKNGKESPFGFTPRRSNSVQVQAVSPIPKNAVARTNTTPICPAGDLTRQGYSRYRNHRERDSRRAMTIDISATLKSASMTPRPMTNSLNPSSEHLNFTHQNIKQTTTPQHSHINSLPRSTQNNSYNQHFQELPSLNNKENHLPLSIEFQRDVSQYVNNIAWKKLEENSSSVFVLPEAVSESNINNLESQLHQLPPNSSSSPDGAPCSKIIELQSERDDLELKLKVYRKYISQAMTKLQNQFPENKTELTEPGKKLLNYLDFALHSAKDREQTLITQLHETRKRNEFSPTTDDEYHETEEEQKNLADINKSLLLEKEKLIKKISDLEHLQKSVETDKVADPTSKNPKHPRPTPIQIDTTTAPDLALSPSQESPPAFVKKMKNLDKEFSESSERMQSRVQELSNINSKVNSSQSTSSSVHSGSHIELNIEQQSSKFETTQENNTVNLTSNTVSNSNTGPCLPPSNSSGILATSPENQPVRRRRNRNKQETDNLVEISKTEMLKLQDDLSAANHRIATLQSKLEGCTTTTIAPSDQSKKTTNCSPKTVVANKVATKKIKELLAKTANQKLNEDVYSSILKLLNESQHDENYKLLHRDRWEATVKKLAQLENEITKNDDNFTKNIQTESARLADIYKQNAQKQINEYKSKLDIKVKKAEAVKEAEAKHRAEVKHQAEFEKQIEADIEAQRVALEKETLEKEARKNQAKQYEVVLYESKKLAEQLANLEKTKQEQSKTESGLLSENSELKSSIKLLQTQIGEYKSKTDQMNKVIGDLELRIKKFQYENEAGQKRLVEESDRIHTEKLLDLQGRLVSLEKEKDSVDLKLASTESELESMKHQLTRSQKQVQRVKNRAVERLDDAYSAIRAESVGEINQKLRDFQAAKKSKFHAEIEQFSTDCNIVRGLLSKFDNQSPEQNTSMPYNELEELYGHARLEVSECRETIENLKSKLTTAKKLSSIDTNLTPEQVTKNSTTNSKSTLLALFADWMESDDWQEDREKSSISDAEVQLRILISKLLEM